MDVSRSSHEEPAGTVVVPTSSLLKGCLAYSPLCVGQFTLSRCRTSRRWIRFGLFALGLPRSAVVLGAFRASCLPFDGRAWAILAKAEFLAALPILNGASAPEFQLLLLSEAGPRGLGRFLVFGGACSCFAAGIGGFTLLG